MKRIALQRNSLSRSIDKKNMYASTTQTFVDNRLDTEKVAELKKVMQNTTVQRKVVQMVKKIRNITTGEERNINDLDKIPDGWVELKLGVPLADSIKGVLLPVKPKHLKAAKARGVKLGEAHKFGSKTPGKSKSTPKVEERIIRHMNEHLKGNKSKATLLGRKDGDLIWAIERSIKSRQATKGSRIVLQHIGSGDATSPPDAFESGRGQMSESEDSE